MNGVGQGSTDRGARCRSRRPSLVVRVDAWLNARRRQSARHRVFGRERSERLERCGQRDRQHLAARGRGPEPGQRQSLRVLLPELPYRRRVLGHGHDERVGPLLHRRRGVFGDRDVARTGQAREQYRRHRHEHYARVREPDAYCRSVALHWRLLVQRVGRDNQRRGESDAGVLELVVIGRNLGVRGTRSSKSSRSSPCRSAGCRASRAATFANGPGRCGSATATARTCSSRAPSARAPGRSSG
jgi:hypothetical protein